MTSRDVKRLSGVHPKIVSRLGDVFAAMRILGWPMFVVSGVRSTEDQARLFAKGRTAPGVRVTNADGVTKKSDHQVQDDGYGHAVDCAFVDHQETSEDETWSGPWELFGEMVKAKGLRWGGDWSSIKDRPHVYL